MASLARMREIIRAVNTAYHTDGGLEGVNRLLGTVVARDLDLDEMVSFLRSAATGREEMPNHAILLRECCEELRCRGVPEAEIARNFHGLLPK